MWEERSSWFVFRIPRDTSEWGLFILLICLTGSPSPTRWIRGWGLHFLFMPRAITTNRTNWAKGAHIVVDGTYIQVKNECNITGNSGSCIPHVWLCNLSSVQSQDTQHLPVVFYTRIIQLHWLCKNPCSELEHTFLHQIQPTRWIVLRSLYFNHGCHLA